MAGGARGDWTGSRRPGRCRDRSLPARDRWEARGRRERRDRRGLGRGRRDRAGSAGAWAGTVGGVGGVGGRFGSGGGARFGEQFLEAGGPDAAEGPVVAGTVQDGHFELGGRELGALAVARGGQRVQGGGERLGQRHVVGVPLLQRGGYLVGLAAEGHEAGLVGYRSVERDPVDLVVRGRRGHLGHHDLHLEGLRALGEDRAERLRVPVGDAARRHIVPVELVAGDVGVGDPGLTQVLVLVVAADRGEADPVVDLADLVQRAGRVRRHQEDPARVLQCHAAAAARDALPRVVGLVPHGLFW